MTAVGHPRLHSPASPKRVLAFLWDTWSGITWRVFLYVMLAGITVATVQGIGHVVWRADRSWSSGFLMVFLPIVVQAFLMLLCLSVAGRVTTMRGPRWTPFVAAAAVGTLASSMIDFALIAPAFTVSPELFSRQWMVAMWFNLPSYMLIGVLASLGYMRWVDAARRTEALRNLQLERTRLERDTYQSRLQTLQARVEPNFLFETLRDVEASYAIDPALGQRLLDDLIAYLRTALPALDDPTSTLGAELLLATTWHDIMRIRCGRGPAMVLAGPESIPEARIPRMLLLPVVQRAFEADAGMGGTPGDIAIVATVADERLRIVVSASGRAFGGDPGTSAVAVRDHVAAMYGDTASLTFRSLDERTSEAVLEIPHEHTQRRHR